MANWWSLVNCWGRRDTRAKKVIVIEYKSHQVKKAVTELYTQSGGPCGHMADAADLRTWPGTSGLCRRAQSSPPLRSLSSQASLVTGAWARAASDPQAVRRLLGHRLTGPAGPLAVSPPSVTQRSRAPVGSLAMLPLQTSPAQPASRAARPLQDSRMQGWKGL